MPELATHSLLIGPAAIRNAGAAARPPANGTDAGEPDFGAAFAEADAAWLTEPATGHPGVAKKKGTASAEAATPQHTEGNHDDKAALTALAVVPPVTFDDPKPETPDGAMAVEAEPFTERLDPRGGTRDRRTVIADRSLSGASASAPGSGLPPAGGTGSDASAHGSGTQVSSQGRVDINAASPESATAAHGKTAAVLGLGASTNLEGGPSTLAGDGEAALPGTLIQPQRANSAGEVSAKAGPGAAHSALSATTRPASPASGRRGSAGARAVADGTAALPAATTTPAWAAADRPSEIFSPQMERPLTSGLLLPSAPGESTLPQTASTPTLAAFGLSPSSAAPLPQLAVAAPVGSAGFVEEFTQRVAMMTRGGVHRAEVSLTPAELGPVEISIEVRGDEATLLFTAPHAATRAALDEALPRLREMLSAQGLQLADARVGTQAGGGSWRDSERRPQGFVAATDRVQAAPDAAAPAAAASARPRMARLIDDIA